MMDNRVAERRRQFPTGTRLKAVRFVLDEGLRIWPVQNHTLGTPQEKWRVVRVADQQVKETLMSGTFLECQQAFPDAVAGINDNESVPAGTGGTVNFVDGTGTVFVKWDNGRSIGVTVRDTVVLA